MGGQNTAHGLHPAR